MKTITKLFLETIPVIFGVLIALLIGDWKANYDDLEYMDKMIAVMKEEAYTNLEDLNSVIPTHIRMIDTVDANLIDESLSVRDLVDLKDSETFVPVNLSPFSLLLLQNLLSYLHK